MTGIAIGSRARALGPRGSDRSGPFMYNIYVVGMNARPDDQRLHTRLKGHKRLIPSTTVTPREADYSDSTCVLALPGLRAICRVGQHIIFNIAILQGSGHMGLNPVCGVLVGHSSVQVPGPVDHQGPDLHNG